VAAGSPVTVTLDRSTPNIRAGQKIWFVHPSAASVERVDVLTKPAANQFTCNISNSYPSGTLVGEDPTPIGILSTYAAASPSQLSTKGFRFPFNVDATRASAADGLSQTMSADTDAGTSETFIDPDGATYYQGQRIMGQRGSAPSGVRGPLYNCASFPIGVQNDQDLMRNGDPITDDYKIFVTQLVDLGWAFAIGPGATP
jgi:hypothetical protein